MMLLQGLLVVAAGGVDSGSLTSGGDWSAVPATLPVVALAFVYHNIIPVICTALEGDVAKIRTAVLAGARSLLSSQRVSTPKEKKGACDTICNAGTHR
jgi:amino acid permease